MYCISTNQNFSSPKTSSRTPYSNSKQQEKPKHSAENTINFSALVVTLPFFDGQCWDDTESKI